MKSVKTISYLLPAILLFLMITPPALAYPVPEDARHLTLQRRTRKLLFLPLKNQTGEKELNYLSYGIPVLIFSAIRTNFLIEGQALTDRSLSPVPAEPPADRPAGSVLLTAALLDFRSAALRERQRGIPAGLSLIPAKEAELQNAQPEETAVRYGAEWFVYGTIEYESVPDPEFIDPQGRRIRITPELRKQFEGRELPAQWKKLLEEKKPENIIVRIYLRSFEYNGILWSHTWLLRADNPYESADFLTPARALEERIRAANPHRLRISSTRPGFVFLDGAFAGKTPLDIRVPGSAIDVRVEQDGCKPYHNQWKPGESTSIQAACSKDQGRSVLSVVSLPDGADVYLDHEYLGRTPLRRSDLLPGVHRVRVSAKGYIDGFYGVELKDDRPVDLVAQLRPGDTVEYYTDPGYAIQDWTYDDMSLGLFLQSLAFGMGWAYANVRAGEIRDSIRSPWLPYFYPDPSYGIIQYWILEDARLRALKWERSGRMLAGLGAFSLLGSACFLYRSFRHDDRPFGEIGVRPEPVLFSMPGSGEAIYGAGIRWSY
jgi:hypothetical protein